MRTYLIALFALVVMLSCTESNSKSVYVEHFKEFIEEIEQDEDFEITDEVKAKYDEYADELFNKHKEELTPEEQKEIGRLKARYVKAQLKRAADAASKAADKYGKQAEGFINELFGDDDEAE